MVSTAKGEEMNERLSFGIVLTTFPLALFGMWLLDMTARYFGRWVWTGLPIEVTLTIVAVICVTMLSFGLRILDEEWKNHLERQRVEEKVND
jgi:hypothetical protein